MISPLKFILATRSTEKVHLNLRLFFNLNEPMFNLLIGIMIYRFLKKYNPVFTRHDIVKTLLKVTELNYTRNKGIEKNFKALEEMGFITFAFVKNTSPKREVRHYTINDNKLNHFLAIYQGFINRFSNYNVRIINDIKVPPADIRKASKDVTQHMQKLRKLKKKK